MKVEIKYGRKEFDGKLCGYATFEEDGHKMELICPPYESLIVLKDGKRVPCERKYVWAWTRVAGWLGAQEMVNKIRASR